MDCVSDCARIECKRRPKRHQSLLDKSNDPNKRNAIYDSSSTKAEQNTDEEKREQQKQERRRKKSEKTIRTAQLSTTLKMKNEFL